MFILVNTVDACIELEPWISIVCLGIKGRHRTLNAFL